MSPCESILYIEDPPTGTPSLYSSAMIGVQASSKSLASLRHCVSQSLLQLRRKHTTRPFMLFVLRYQVLDLETPFQAIMLDFRTQL